jgi:hypothetical protein
MSEDAFFDPIARGLAAGAAASVTSLSLKTRLQNAAARAVDPHILPPWKVPAAWAQSTAYRAGEVVVANGLWWVAQNTATSNASGTGPNAPDTTNVVPDGTMQWLFLGAPTSLSDDAQAPTVSRSTSAPSSPNNVPWGLAVSSSADILRIYGGRQNPGNTDRYRIATFDRSASSTLRGSGGRLAFWSNAATISFLTSGISGGSEGPFRILVDGRYVTPSGFSNNNVNTYTTIAWTAKKARFYEIEGWSREGVFFSLITIFTSQTDHIWKPATDGDIRAYWISDSQCAGHSFGPYTPGGGLPFRVGRKLGWNDVWNASIGGTGWTNAGTGPYYKFGERIAEGLTRNPDIWVFDGSSNDNGAAGIAAAVTSGIQAIRAGGSTAPIIVLGVLPISAGCATTEAAIAAGVTAAGDSNAYFIPRSTAALPPIIGSFNRPATLNANVNSMALDINTSDNVHMMEGVMDKHAAWIADAIKTAVLPNL